MIINTYAINLGHGAARRIATNIGQAAGGYCAKIKFKRGQELLRWCAL
jgi:hypothetical protein